MQLGEGDAGRLGQGKDAARTPDTKNNAVNSLAFIAFRRRVLTTRWRYMAARG